MNIAYYIYISSTGIYSTIGSDGLHQFLQKNPGSAPKVHPRPTGATALDGLWPCGPRFAVPRAGWSLVDGGAAALEGAMDGNFWGKNGRNWWFLEREHGKRYVKCHFLGGIWHFNLPEVLETLSWISLDFIGPCSIKSQPIVEKMGLTSKHVHIISKPRRRHRISPARKGTHLDWGKNIGNMGH